MRKALILILCIMLIPVVFASTAPSASFPKSILFFDRVNANEVQIKTIEDSEIRITSIGTITNETALRSRIIVQAMPDCPKNAPYQTGLLQCFFLSEQNFGEKLKEIQVYFKVPKEWIERNGFSDVELRRYSYTWNKDGAGVLGNWKILETNKEKEDDKYAYYEAKSDGIEYLSIVGIKSNNVPELNSEEKQTHVEEVKENDKESEKEPFTENSISANSDNQITGNFALNEEINKSPIMLIIFGIVVAAGLTSLPFTINKKDEETQFSKMVSYIESNDREDAINNLRDAGWESWQIDLALKEIKERE